MSMQNAVKAKRAGWHQDHVVPFEFEWENQNHQVAEDETIRDKSLDDPEGFMEDLKKLKPPFKPDGGLVTAGNSSQIVDGAAPSF